MAETRLANRLNQLDPLWSLGDGATASSIAHPGSRGCDWARTIDIRRRPSAAPPGSRRRRNVAHEHPPGRPPLRSTPALRNGSRTLLLISHESASAFWGTRSRLRLTVPLRLRSARRPGLTTGPARSRAMRFMRSSVRGDAPSGGAHTPSDRT
jgi:hypothetical protein